MMAFNLNTVGKFYVSYLHMPTVMVALNVGVVLRKTLMTLARKDPKRSTPPLLLALKRGGLLKVPCLMVV